VGTDGPPLGGEAVVEGVRGELDEPVGEAAGSAALVAHPGPAADHLEGDPDGGPADWVEAAVHGHVAVLALA
jgi:hypothetical protein